MPAKRTTLPPELMAEWADDRAVGDVRVIHKAKWRCKSGHEWEAKINDRLRGVGCARCSGNFRGSFRGHPDFQ